MHGVFGLARSGPRVVFACGLGAASIGGCGGEQLVVGQERGGPTAGSGGMESSAGAGEARPPGVALTDECPTTPLQRQALLGCWPTRHIGRWRGFFTGNPSYESLDGRQSEFPVGDLWLSVGVNGEGRLSFGDSAPPLPSMGGRDAYLCAGTSPESGCPAARRLVEGFVYPLEQMEIVDAQLEPAPRIEGEDLLRVGERLSFGVPLAAPWRDWCELQEPEPSDCVCAEACESAPPECFRFAPDPDDVDASTCEVREGSSARSVDCAYLAARQNAPCSCDAEGCFAAAPSLSISLRMSEDGEALRGAYVPRNLGLQPVRLEFRRERTP